MIKEAPMAPMEKKCSGMTNSPSFKLQDLGKGPPHSLIGGHPALEGNRLEDIFPLGDIAFQIPGHGKTESGDDVVIRSGLLLEMNHIGLGKDGAAAGNAGRGFGFQGQLAEFFDGQAQAVGLLIQEGAGPGRAKGVHGKILDEKARPFLFPQAGSIWSPRRPFQ